MSNIILNEKTYTEYGYETTWAHTDAYVGKILHIESGSYFDIENLTTKDQSIMVQYGRIQLTCSKQHADKKTLTMVPGDSFCFAPKTLISINACQEADLVTLSAAPTIRDNKKYNDKKIINKKKFFLTRMLNWIAEQF